MTLIELKTQEINRLCKTNKVKSLIAFGSITREDFNKNSDINLVVDFEEDDPFKYTDLYFSLKNKLEELFNRQIELLEDRAIRNKYFRQQLDSTKIKIYGH